MTLAIKAIRTATAGEWDYIWKNCDYATYFHSREWTEIWQKYTQGKMQPDAKIVEFSDRKTAILPFSSQRILKGFDKQYVLSPAGTFGGWLSLDKLSTDHGKFLYQYLGEHCKNLMWRLNPYDSLANQLNIVGTEKDVTHALNLEDGFEVIYRRWTKGHASAARKARKVGVEIKTAVCREEWKEYYGVYEESQKRWGNKMSSRYSYRLFDIIEKTNSPNVRLWLSFYDNKIVAGALCFYAKKHVVYWHGAALLEYFNLRPVNLLLYEIIKDACERGYRWFDFNPSGGHEGVMKFKKSFGATEFSSNIVIKESMPYKIIRNSYAKMKGLYKNVIKN